MRTLSAVEFLSMDGVMQAPGSPDEDPDGRFELGGWQRDYFDPEMAAEAASGMPQTDAYLFGRKTFQGFAGYWPTVSDDDPFARSLNATAKYVATRSGYTPTWSNTQVLSGELVPQVAELKERAGGTICVLGSGDLLQTLFAADLVDTLSITISPLVLGSGKRLFRTVAGPKKFELQSCRATSSGSVMLGYGRAR